MADARNPNSRKPRQERDTEVRTKQWQPASLLPTPDPEDGYTFRWVRKTMLGIDDPSNFSRKVRDEAIC